MTKIKIERAKATAREREIFTAGMVGAKIAFSFDEEWNGLEKTAVFSCGDTLLDVPESDWTDGVCTVPHECMTREGLLLTVGVYGVNSDGSVAIPTVYATLGRICRGADPSGNEGGAATLPIWLRLSEMMGDLSELETEDKSDLVAAINEVSESLDEHKVDGNAHSDIRALIRKTWYVTVTRASDGTVTADKTPQEIYEAYQAGFPVYAMTSTFPGFNVPFLIPCLAAIEFLGTYQIGFAASGTTAATTSPTSMVIFYDGSTWAMWDHKLVSTDDIVDNLTTGDSTKVLSAAQGKVLKGLIDGITIPTVPTTLPNPNALTIKIGDSTVVYDGSAAKTVEIADGSEVEY